MGAKLEVASNEIPNTGFCKMDKKKLPEGSEGERLTDIDAVNDFITARFEEIFNFVGGVKFI